MATKSKSKRSTSKAKRSAPKGILRSFDQNPFAAKAKVEVYDAFGIPPEGVPPGKPVRTATVKADGSLQVRVPKKGAYVVVSETDDGDVQRLHFHVK